VAFFWFGCPVADHWGEAGRVQRWDGLEVERFRGMVLFFEKVRQKGTFLARFLKIRVGKE
jgi:hypothetical protein